MKEKIIAFTQAIYISIIGLFILSLGILIWICVGFIVYWILKHFNEPLAYIGAVLSVALLHLFWWHMSKCNNGSGLATAFMQCVIDLLIFPTRLILFGWEYCVVAFVGLMEED